MKINHHLKLFSFVSTIFLSFFVMACSNLFQSNAGISFSIPDNVLQNIASHARDAAEENGISSTLQDTLLVSLEVALYDQETGKSIKTQTVTAVL